MARDIVLKPLTYSSSQLDAYANQLQHELADFSIFLNHEQIELCILHLLYVLQVNEYINLTRITALSDAITLHIVDSLLFLKLAPTEFNSFLDMGTGAGFPGIPFHIATSADGVLLDSVQKKITFNNAVIEQLHFAGLSAVHDRLESYALKQRCFDVVIARALAPLPVLVEYAAPLLNDRGTLLVSKGNISQDELDSGNQAAHICGLQCLNSSSFELPSRRGHRTLFSFVKLSQPNIALPRSVGCAKRNPLA